MCEGLSCMLTFALAALSFPDCSSGRKQCFLSAAALLAILCVLVSPSLFIDLERAAINYSYHSVSLAVLHLGFSDENNQSNFDTVRRKYLIKH